jgi:ABC-type Na+ efflux pump permease subunit
MSWKAIAIKEFRSIRREKTLLLTFLIQLFIASFAAFLATGVFTYLSPEALEGYYEPKAELAIVVKEPKHELIRYIVEKGGLSLYTMEKFDQAVRAFYRGEVDGILVIPEEKASGNKPVKIDLYLPKMDVRATVIASRLKEPIERYESSVRSSRAARLPQDLREVMSYEIELPKAKRASSYYEFVYGILIPLLLIAPALIAGGLIIDLLTEETEKKTMGLLLSSPTGLPHVLDGKAIVSVLTAVSQSILWLFLLELNGIPIYNKLPLAVFVTAITMFLVAMGSFISLYYGRRGVSHLVYSLLLLNLFIASLLFPNASPMGVITKLALNAQGIAALQGFLAYVLGAPLAYAALRASLSRKTMLLRVSRML